MTTHMERWRYIVEDAVEAAHGLGGDEVLLEQTRQASGDAGCGAALRLYTYRSHCALVGLFQSIEAEIDLDACARLGISVNRRPSGGGAIIMGAEQLGIAVAFPRESGGAWDTSFVSRCHDAVVRGLAGLGLDARFRPRNDIVVEDRKICGTGALGHEGGGILYHASILLDLDVPLMCEVLKSGVGKHPEKAAAALSERLTTIRRELSSDVDVEMEQLRESVAAGFCDEFGIALERDEFSCEEMEGIGLISASKFANPEWIDSVCPSREGKASAAIRTPGGMLSAHVALSGGTIKSVTFDGDFFGERATLNAVEGALKWSRADEASIGRAIGAALRRSSGSLSVSAESLTDAVMQAVHARMAT
jgi:lipoate-protein ligase A